jgi:hypothetical protein
MDYDELNELISLMRAIVYGDYTRQIEKLSTLMGFEVVKNLRSGGSV